VALGKRTLNADMDVVLGLLCLSCIFIGFGEGVCVTNVSMLYHLKTEAISRAALLRIGPHPQPANGEL
jgi:hypothetical protein